MRADSQVVAVGEACPYFLCPRYSSAVRSCMRGVASRADWRRGDDQFCISSQR